jgi:ketosteroid isomerase-like protein
MPNATSEKRPTTDRAHMERVIRAIFERRADGDAEGMFKFAAPDLVYKAAAWQTYAGRITGRGRAECFEIARQINVTLENLGSEFHEFVIDGDHAATLRTARLRNRGSGKTVSIDIWDFVTFRDGLVAAFEEYPDTAKIEEIGTCGS